MSEPWLFVLPWPPSTNRLWRAVLVGRAIRNILSKPAREYKAAAAAALLTQPGPRTALAGRLAVSVTMHAPSRRAFDLDNHVKAASDALTAAKVWGDDAQIDRLLLIRGAVDRKAPRLEITVEEL